MSYLKKVEKQREKNREAERRRARKKAVVSPLGFGARKIEPLPAGKTSPFRQELDSMTIHRSKRSLARDKALLEDESPGDDI